jgi:hypothetical protein
MFWWCFWVPHAEKLGNGQKGEKNDLRFKEKDDRISFTLQPFCTKFLNCPCTYKRTKTPQEKIYEIK